MLQTIFDSSPDFDVGINEILDVDVEPEGDGNDVGETESADGVTAVVDDPVELKDYTKDQELPPPPPTTTTTTPAPPNTIDPPTAKEDTIVDITSDASDETAPTTPEERAARIITDIAKPI